MNSRKPDRPAARNALKRIVAMKEYFPREASIAEAKLRELKLVD